MKKRSFFERLSGSVPISDDFDSFDDEFEQKPVRKITPSSSQSVRETHEEPPQDEGQLPVDVYQTPGEIVIRTFIAGVRPDEMNVSISRDMVVVEGSREERSSISEEDYFHRELFWGSFSKTILLPQEVDVDNSSATAKDGLLTIILPKLDKARQTKLRVKTG
jgi:HSP20 family molecular chaperone IbpA